MHDELSPPRRAARAIAELGPIGRHSRRPALAATALAAALFGFLPEDPGIRVVAVLGLVVLGEAAVRLGGPWRTGAGRALNPGGQPLIDRCAGMWCALLPLPSSLALLLIGLGLFHLLETTQVGPIGWASRAAGGRHHVQDDVLAGLLVGTALVLVSKVLYML